VLVLLLIDKIFESLWGFNDGMSQTESTNSYIPFTTWSKTTTRDSNYVSLLKNFSKNVPRFWAREMNPNIGCIFTTINCQTKRSQSINQHPCILHVVVDKGLYGLKFSTITPMPKQFHTDHSSKEATIWTKQ